MSAYANPLFRYVAVRPVQTQNRTRERFRFLRPPDPLTPFRKDLKNAAGWAGARSVAAVYIASAEWLGSRLETDGRLLILRRVYSAMKEASAARDASGIQELVRRMIEDSLKLESLPALQDDLWDGLIACYVAPREKARDRAAFVDCLRGLHFILQHDSFESVYDLTDLVGATAVIPEWIGHGTGAPADDTPSEPTPHGYPQIETIRKIRGQVLKIDAALDDLDLAYAEARREARSPKPPPGKLAKNDAGAPRPSRVLHPPPAPPSRPPWTNSVVLRGKLKDDTASILDGLDPVWAYRSQDDAIAKLESRRSFLTSDLRRLGGRLR
jgi:hypothetical protein